MKGRWEKYRKKNYNASVKKKEVKNNEQMKKWLNNWFKESVEFYGSMFRYGMYYR